MPKKSKKSPAVIPTPDTLETTPEETKPVEAAAVLPEVPAPKPAGPYPTSGRFLQYVLNEQDVMRIERRHAHAAQLCIQANKPAVGESYPMLVVRVTAETINGQVFLDGNDTEWVSTIVQGTDPGGWSWPPRA